ncbi:MAG: amidohydrolase [Bacteroidales bacterium]|nr:amidohydrolase [Bacteroidales bacterium]
MKYINVYVSGHAMDIEVDGGIITSLTPSKASDAPTRWAVPGLVNMHAHSAMTLLRSAGSGLPLMRWLQEAIFPREAQLTDEDIYRGALEACHEMLATGTHTVNDMYFSIDSTLRAASETGMQIALSHSMIDRNFDDPELWQWTQRFLKDYERRLTMQEPHVRHVISPHAIYTVSGPHLQYLADFAKEHNMLFHMHISETQAERENCIKTHGVPPVVYLEKLGIFDKVGSHFIGAHALWLDETEIGILGGHGCTVVHCPNSNLKLGSGSLFKYCEMRAAGVNVTLGTDGCASSDNLDMLEAMKIMSLLQKGNHQDPTVLGAREVLDVATRCGARALGFDDRDIAVGAPATFFLVNLNNHHFNHIDWPTLTAEERDEQFCNRLVYSAGSRAIVNE